jgi:hypothetical protein
LRQVFESAFVKYDVEPQFSFKISRTVDPLDVLSEEIEFLAGKIVGWKQGVNFLGDNFVAAVVLSVDLAPELDYVYGIVLVTHEDFECV